MEFAIFMINESIHNHSPKSLQTWGERWLWSSQKHVALSKVSMAQKCFYWRDMSWRISVECRPLSRTTFWWLEGHGFGSSEGGDDRSISQASLGEMNGDMNFTSLNNSWLGWCFTIGFWARDRCGGGSFPNLFIKASIGCLLFFKG